MKKEMTINYAHIEGTDERAIVEMIASALNIPREWLRKYYSAIMSREITSHQASLITRTQLALIAVIILAPQSAILGIAATAALAYSIVKCKQQFK